LDDLPYAADPQRRQQLAGSIRDLAGSARCPVVVVSTDIGAGGGSAAGRGPQGAGSGAAGSSKGLPKVRGTRPPRQYGRLDKPLKCVGLEVILMTA
jgi:hypothetical protein